RVISSRSVASSRITHPGCWLCRFGMNKGSFGRSPKKQFRTSILCRHGVALFREACVSSKLSKFFSHALEPFGVRERRIGTAAANERLM
ncbi:MAG TPA: hypothetical protein VF226_05435, partial [Hyphomicrobiaceae bacterium]